MLMTGAQYIESLRKLNTRVYLFGEEVKNWVDHPMIRPSIDCVAVTYDLAHKPEYEDLMTAKSHMTGEKVNRFCHIHQSTDDLRKKVKMQRLLGQKTASCFQRCVGMDSFNAVYSTTFEMLVLPTYRVLERKAIVAAKPTRSVPARGFPNR